MIGALVCLSCLLCTGEPVSRYGHDVWRGEQGLPHESVRGIAQTKDGFLWLATTGTLTRFDGIQFKTVGAAELASTQTTSLLPLADGLLVGTHRGLYLVSGDKVQLVQPAASGLNSISALARADDGSLWAGTEHGLFRSSGGNDLRFTAVGAESLPSNTITSLSAASDGSLWIGTRRGLARWRRNGSIVSVPLQKIDNPRVRSIYAGRDGRVWVGTESTGLFSGPPDRIIPTGAGPLRSSSITSIVGDQHGAIWIGTWDRGIMRLSADGVEPYSSTLR